MAVRFLSSETNVPTSSEVTLTKQQSAEVVDLVSLDLDLQAVLGPRDRSDSGASLASLLQYGSHRTRVQTIGLQVPDQGHLGKTD